MTYAVRRCSFVGLVAVGFLASVFDRAGAGESDLTTLEGLVRQWTELRRQTADEARDWEDRERQLREEIRLLTHERDARIEARDEAEEREARELRRMEELRARQTELQTAAERLDPVLARAETRLDAFRTWVPDSLVSTQEVLFPRSPAPETSDAAARAQSVAAGLAGIERVQEGVHSVREIRDPDGRGPAREFEVLYVGLARGFAWSADGKIAAVGEPDSDGWVWSLRPEWATRVADALDAYRIRDARLVQLPFRFSKEDAP